MKADNYRDNQANGEDQHLTRLKNAMGPANPKKYQFPLEKSCRCPDYPNVLVQTATPRQESLRIAQDVCASIDQYFAALTTSLGRLVRNNWELDKSADEQLAPTIELLEKRIFDMRVLAAALAETRPE